MPDTRPDPMPLYSFAVPVARNDGRLYLAALALWESACLDVAGGFTRRPDGQGLWKDGDGTVYVDVMANYQVACNPTQCKALLAKAFELFPDQLAIFVAEIGEARIYPRP